jgi:hypothetical protein
MAAVGQAPMAAFGEKLRSLNRQQGGWLADEVIVIGNAQTPLMIF